MPDSAALTSLLARVEAATGADDQLAVDICQAFMERPDYLSLAYPIAEAVNNGSVDAAIRFVERLLEGPRLCFRLEKLRPGDARTLGFAYWASAGPSGEQEHGYGATPALALLAAALRALSAIAQKEPADA